MATKINLPAMPFYVGDWLKCPEVKVLPPDVRGLWFDMICYMWESVERGVMVKPTHHPYSKDEIVRMIGLDCNNSDKWLDILIENGVCAIRDTDGAIYSRRMVRDEDIRQKRSKAGKMGGTKTAKLLKKSNMDQPSETPPPPLTTEQKEKAEKAKKYKYADYVTLTKDEYAKLSSQYSDDSAKRMIDILNNYKGSSGKRYKSDYMAILNWVVDRYNEELQKNGIERKTDERNGCSQNNKGVPGSTLQANPGTSSECDIYSKKDYSERF